MSGDVKITGCVSGSPCPYKLLGGTISECGYWGNCIYKRPQELKEAIPNDGKMPLFDRMVRQRDADMKVLEEKVQQVRREEWRRIFKAMHITRKQMLELPMDIRQDILEQQVNNYLENITDEEKLEDINKLDGG